MKTTPATQKQSSAIPILAAVQTAENYIGCVLVPDQLTAAEDFILSMLRRYGHSERALFHANALRSLIHVKRCELIAFS